MVRHRRCRCSSPIAQLINLKESFELSLDHYNIKDSKASGDLIHFLDNNNNNNHNLQVTLVLLNSYDPPILACDVHEVLSQIINGAVSGMPTIIAPFLVASSKLKCDSKALASNNIKDPLYVLHTGPETAIHSTITAKTKRPPPSMQIYDEPLACFLQLARNLKSPTTILIGQRYQSTSNKEDLQVLCEIGDVLASSTSLCFFSDKVTWNPSKNSKDSSEPWRALYG
ncbi:hypothetical protein ACFE04_021824 [Oxalis oulophora]